MKEIPILYSTPMIQAKLAGRKTQTRRIIKAPKGAYGFYVVKNHEGIITQILAHDEHERTEKKNGTEWVIKCPYGKPGDLLYAREKWRPVAWDFEDYDTTVIQYADGSRSMPMSLFGEDYDKEIELLARCCDKMHDRCEPKFVDEENYSWTKEQIEEHMPWRPGIHMPKAAARIWDRVVSVRVERLQDISEEDAIAEGIEEQWVDLTTQTLLRRNYLKSDSKTLQGKTLPVFEMDMSGRESYRTLWESINGQGSWEANPWVWVITTETLSTTGKPQMI